MTQPSDGSLPGCTSWQLRQILFRGAKFLIDWRQVVDDELQLQFGPVHQVGPTGPKLKKWPKTRMFQEHAKVSVVRRAAHELVRSGTFRTFATIHPAAGSRMKQALLFGWRREKSVGIKEPTTASVFLTVIMPSTTLAGMRVACRKRVFETVPGPLGNEPRCPDCGP